MYPSSVVGRNMVLEVQQGRDAEGTGLAGGRGVLGGGHGAAGGKTRGGLSGFTFISFTLQAMEEHCTFGC